MHVTPRRTWQEALHEAVHETDPHLAEIKIRNAEIALFRRIHAFSPNSDFSEEQALFDALHTIRLLRGARRISPSLGPDHNEQPQNPSAR